MSEFTSTVTPLGRPPVADRTSEEIDVPSHSLSRRSRTWMLWIIVIGLLVWSWGPAEMFRAGSLISDWRNMAEFGQAFLRPDFHEWRSYIDDMMVTVQIAIWGTALAAVLGDLRVGVVLRQHQPRVGLVVA